MVKDGYGQAEEDDLANPASEQRHHQTECVRSEHQRGEPDRRDDRAAVQGDPCGARQDRSRHGDVPAPDLQVGRYRPRRGAFALGGGLSHVRSALPVSAAMWPPLTQICASSVLP
jgi:hypothetical protein